MNLQLKTYIVDSFTEEPFKGNPAGVCLCDEPLSESRMQAIARELNLSETAFVVPGPDSVQFLIRYFSPKMEIPLCGHATLAASKVLFETERMNKLRFTTGEELVLPIGLVGDLIQMEFPVYELSEASAPDSLLQALGLTDIRFCGYNEETRILMLEISNTADLSSLRPDFNALLQSHDSINGVLVTAQSTDEYDFHSRYFWPWSGSNEDPVTGGTHTFLAKYWGDKLGKSVMRSFQSSERTGHMEVELVSREKLLIRGSAIIIFAGGIKV